MPNIDPIPLIMATGAFFPVAFLPPALRRARAAGDLDASALLTFSMGWLVSLPIALAVISGRVMHREDVFRELVPILPSWYSTALDICLVLLISIAGVLIVRRLLAEGTSVVLNTAGLLAIALWLVAHLASGLHGKPLLTFDGIALLICLFATLVLPRGRGACVGIGMFGVTLAVASCALALVNFPQASVACRHECLLGSAITGVMPNENLFGTAIVTTIPFAFLGFRGPARVWLTAYLVSVAVVTGSRGALIIGAVLLVALLIVRPSLDPAPRRTGPTSVAVLILIGSLIASVYVVAHDWRSSPISLTGRPLLWSVATDYIDRSPAFGYGPYEWEAVYSERSEVPAAAQHSTHNQWIDVLFTAGWVGAGLLVAVIVAALWTAGPARPAVIMVLAAIMLTGVGERAWSVGVIDFVSFSLIGFILLGPGRAKDATAPQPKLLGAPSRRPLALSSR
jgi:O-antigen ligase